MRLRLKVAAVVCGAWLYALTAAGAVWQRMAPRMAKSLAVFGFSLARQTDCVKMRKSVALSRVERRQPRQNQTWTLPNLTGKPKLFTKDLKVSL